MRKVYRSKISLRIFLPACLILILGTVLFLGIRLWIPAALCVILLGMLVHLCYHTFYEITSHQKLLIVCGFIYRKELYIHSIRKTRFTHDHSIAPALSTQRVQIFFNRYGSVLISPESPQDFVKALHQIHPRILIEKENQKNNPRLFSPSRLIKS